MEISKKQPDVVLPFSVENMQRSYPIPNGIFD